MRPARLCRVWLFVPGAEPGAHAAAAACAADVLIQELEDFTPPERRSEARALAPALYDSWRAAGRVAAVRINPLETCGRDDLAAAMAGRPDIVMMSKVAHPGQVRALDEAIAEHERRLGRAANATTLVPNIESAAGLVRTGAIVAASPRVMAALVASEDMAADLGAERSREAGELAYVRQRFLVECVAAGTVAIDCPYTFADAAGAAADARAARRLGYKAKSAVDPAHVDAINAVLTPSRAEVAEAERLVAAFDAARAAGRDRVEVDGALVELPRYLGAKRLIARARDLGVA
jgi:citrate lyase subunit beta/citryl-CoA lyase